MAPSSSHPSLIHNYNRMRHQESSRKRQDRWVHRYSLSLVATDFCINYMLIRCIQFNVFVNVSNLNRIVMRIGEHHDPEHFFVVELMLYGLRDLRR